MSATQPTATTQVRQQNIAYYDEIADQYDTLLTQEAANTLVRQRVKAQLLQVLPSGTVLDFGGGTGLDLDWLTAHPYKVIFCEPAAGMREKAIRHSQESFPDKPIQFLQDTQTDFTRWQAQRPFPQQVDAILANFGVLNAIPDIGLLFRNLSLVTQPGGHCFAVILDRPFKKMWQWHRRHTVGSLLLGRPFVMYVWHNGYRQTVYVHTAKAIQRAAAPYFALRHCELIAGTSFLLLHLVKQ